MKPVPTELNLDGYRYAVPASRRVSDSEAVGLAMYQDVYVLFTWRDGSASRFRLLGRIAESTATRHLAAFAKAARRDLALAH